MGTEMSHTMVRTTCIDCHKDIWSGDTIAQCQECKEKKTKSRLTPKIVHCTFCGFEDVLYGCIGCQPCCEEAGQELHLQVKPENPRVLVTELGYVYEAWYNSLNESEKILVTNYIKDRYTPIEKVKEVHQLHKSIKKYEDELYWNNGNTKSKLLHREMS